VVARLAKGETVERARAEFAAISSRFAAEYPDSNRNWSSRIVPLHDFLVRDARLSLLVLLGAVALVLLIACANVANIQLSRASARSQEVAMRAALGAGRGRIVRQMLVENVILSFAGGALGLLVAVWGLKIPQALSPGGGLPLGAIRIDASVLAFTCVLSVLTGLLFGLAPAVLTSTSSLSRFLRSGGRELSPSAGRGHMRRALVVAEVALALVLLVGAGLLIKSFARLQGVDPGFRTDRIMTFKLSLPESGYPEPFQRAGFFRELLDEIARLPGVETSGAVSNLPMASDMGDRGFRIEDRPEPGPDETLVLDYSRTTPGYFKTMGVPLVAGRFFTATDTSDATPVVIINSTTAERHWPDGDPVGARIRILGTSDDEPVWRTITGVVGDVRHAGLDTPVAPQVYLPHTQDPNTSMAIAIRTAGDPSAHVDALRTAVRAVDPDLPIAEVRTMDDVVAQAVAPRRLTIFLLGSFAAIALMLAAVGIYGVISYSVSRRTHEFGLRMALGADRLQVLELVIRQGLATTVSGIAIGLLGALGAGRLAAGLLYEISPYDPVVLIGVAVILSAVALLACWLPARRASRLDPMAALRQQ
jgi:predicted permease